MLELVRRRVAREIDFYRTREGLTYDDLAVQIMRAPQVAIQTYNREEYNPLSGKSLRGLVLGSRKTQERVTQAVKRFLEVKRDLPRKNNLSLVFDIDPDVLELARRQSKFLGQHKIPKYIVRRFSGFYEIERFDITQTICIIIDHLDDYNTLLCRGVLRRPNPDFKSNIEDIFVSGYALVLKNKFHIFLTDRHSKRPYIMEIPLFDQSSGEEYLPRLSSSVSYLMSFDDDELDIFEFQKQYQKFSWYEGKSGIVFTPYHFPIDQAQHYLSWRNLFRLYYDVFFDQKACITDQMRHVCHDMDQKYEGDGEFFEIIKSNTPPENVLQNCIENYKNIYINYENFDTYRL